MVVDVDQGTITVTIYSLLPLLLLFGLNVLFYSLWTSRKITKPLGQIAEGIREMQQGRFQKRLNIKASDEFVQVQQYFNDMAESLQRTEAENHRLQMSKDRMLVDLSHDLKTPITTIQGYAKALQLGYADNEDKREKYLQLIYTKSQFVTALIDDIFQMSKLDSPDFPVNMEPGDIAELLREATADYYEQFEDKQFVLNVEIPSDEVRVPHDAVLMRRALSNLLSNALRYNPKGTEVAIRLEQKKDSVRIAIIDNGVGISDELKAVIFEPFVRGDSSRQGDGGTGLGLAIARKMMQRQGGELVLDNRANRTAFELVLYQ
ncbi:HAMP domain-containing sensor histidine kinase [Paenibacillus sp. HW567]|uniref:HAMP domain-containing sensor histidine kinase n=1 Tax=Paenibacillus sp. HW567 TaxID=1034769 RepID=UPI0018DB7F88|nr:HAMP domain-containing sensor histidine kinase [Paenibacillus sp. HW567]